MHSRNYISSFILIWIELYLFNWSNMLYTFPTPDWESKLWTHIHPIDYCYWRTALKVSFRSILDCYMKSKELAINQFYQSISLPPPEIKYSFFFTTCKHLPTYTIIYTHTKFISTNPHPQFITLQSKWFWYLMILIFKKGADPVMQIKFN